MTENITNHEAAGSPEGFIGKPELARRLTKTVRTIDAWMAAGKLPFYKIGRAVMFRWPEVEAHFAAHYRVTRGRPRRMTSLTTTLPSPKAKQATSPTR